MKIIVTPKEALKSLESALLVAGGIITDLERVYKNEDSFAFIAGETADHKTALEAYDFWVRTVTEGFERIFYYPIGDIFKFIQLGEKQNDLKSIKESKSIYHSTQSSIEEIELMCKINGLNDQMSFIIELIEKVKSLQLIPIYYVHEKCLIGMYDQFIALGKDSNQDILCAYTLKNYSFGEMIPIEEIWIKGFGEKTSNYDSVAIEKIINAAKETNKKTNEIWNFSLFRISKPCLKLNFQPPSTR